MQREGMQRAGRLLEALMKWWLAARHLERGLELQMVAWGKGCWRRWETGCW
jgi:hypothetical protein